MNLYVLLVLLSVVSIGTSKSPISTRIIGGQKAYAGQFPYVAAIYKQTSDGSYFCGGGLLNNEWIITSGNCVYNATLFTILLGTTNVKTPDPGSLKLATDTYFVHPEFNLDTLENDIGLIKLRMPITFTTYIKPINKLPSSELVAHTGGIRAVGWGQTSDESSSIEDALHYVLLVPITNDECKLFFGNQVKDTMVCAGGNFNEGFCHGDNGVPLVRLTNGPLTTIMGVASFISHYGCDTAEPSGFTRVFNYLDWIRNVTGMP